MINDRIRLLREKMKENGIDFYIVPSFDAHQSEYVANHWKAREWISGFTGSAGTAVISLKEACLFIDGRYHVQADNQVAGTEIKVFKEGLVGVPSYLQWIKENVEDNQTIGFDGKVFSYKSYKELIKKFERKNVKICADFDLIDEIWEGRPAIPAEEVMELSTQYCGKNRIEKIDDIRKEMKELGADAYIVPNLDDIAWIFNIRGRDIPYCPFSISYGIITSTDAKLFINQDKLSEDVKNSLCNDGIKLKKYEDIYDDLSNLNEEALLFNPAFTSVTLLNSVKDGVVKIPNGFIAEKMKAVKNSIEIENLRNCQVKDGVAMVQFLKWIDESVSNDQVTELNVSEKLKELRSNQELNQGESFNTIAAYRDNAAMMHYSATENSYKKVRERGFLLVDSGGQYLDGTTDITRTISVGELTEEEKIDYTLTLKSHINLAMAKFLKGVTGYYLDILARKPMWDRGMDYKCGTGHGVGFFLSVHEGPQNISYRKNDTVLEPGMIVTNEPGVYKAGKHGIRTENMILVVEDKTTEFGEFLKFETISYCPIDTKPIVKEILAEEEINWLNGYHKMVFEKLSGRLNEEEREFLKTKTMEI